MLATNTSSISITRLAAATDRPERFIGIHFMNPVPVMQLVELIRGIATDDATFESAKAFIAKLGKTATVAEDFPAFIVNRILLPMINEAIYTLYEGVGSVEAIDTAMRLGANHPMGPLQLADFIGLDTCLSVMQVLHEGLADSKYRPCPLLVKYVEAGWLGRKTQARLLRLSRREAGADALTALVRDACSPGDPGPGNGPGREGGRSFVEDLLLRHRRVGVKPIDERHAGGELELGIVSGVSRSSTMTSARSELPCAETSTLPPRITRGRIALQVVGQTRAPVSLRLSPPGG